MLKRIALFLVCVAMLVSSASAQVYVKGYYRSNGTYVQPYYRTSPDGIKSNNYSYPGNFNPNKVYGTRQVPDYHYNSGW